MVQIYAPRSNIQFKFIYSLLSLITPPAKETINLFSVQITYLFIYLYTSAIPSTYYFSNLIQITLHSTVTRGEFI